MGQNQTSASGLEECGNLQSRNTEIVLSALERIKEKGNTGYLTVLFDMLASDPAPEVKKEVLSILGSVRLKQSVPVFIGAIGDDRYLNIRRELLASCWQNGLDYTPYYPFLIQVIVDSDWETAFEAFTIIENSEYLPDAGMCREEAQKIENLGSISDEKKKYFLHAIVNILNNG